MSNPQESQVQKDADQVLKDALEQLKSLTTAETDTTTTTTGVDAKAKEIAAEIVRGSKLLQNDPSQNPEKLGDRNYDDDVYNDYVYDTWCGIFDLVKKTPTEHQQPILDVLQELQNSVIYPRDDTTKEPIRLGDGGILWKDLPTLGWVARDLWNFDVYDKTASAAQQDEWANLTAFLAQLTNLDFENGYSTFALWQLRDTFERERPDKVDPSIGIRLAAIWILYASKGLKAASEKGLELHGRSGIPGDKYKGKEWKGFNMERWGVWRDGFIAASEDAGVDERVRDLAGKAAELMA